MYLTLPFLLFYIQILFNLLSKRLSTLEPQKRLHSKQPQAELKKGCALKKKTCRYFFLSTLYFWDIVGKLVTDYWKKCQLNGSYVFLLVFYSGKFEFSAFLISLLLVWSLASEKNCTNRGRVYKEMHLCIWPTNKITIQTVTMSGWGDFIFPTKSRNDKRIIMGAHMTVTLVDAYNYCFYSV